MGNNNLHIFLPVEIQVRELQGKSLLAFAAAEAGCTVVLGGQKELRRILYKFPAGIYVDKSVAVSKEKWFERFRRLGNKIVAWDEEGLVIHEEQYLDSRFSLKSFSQVELFFAWGKAQRDIIVSRVPERRNDVLLAGNPRFDLLRPELRALYSGAAKKLNKVYGNIILVNTNFGFFNHSKGYKEGKRMFMKSSSYGDESFIDNWIDFQKPLFEHFVTLIQWLSNTYTQHSIIVRPHPSESESEWIRQVGAMPHVKVLKDGSVIDWIVASDVVIHSNCTTGIESYLLGVPTIAYRPVVSETYESYLPNAVSHNAFSFDQAKKEVEGVFNNLELPRSCGKENAESAASRFISNIDGDFSFDFIVKKLLTIKQKERVQTLSEKIARYYQQLFDLLNCQASNLFKILPKYKAADIYDKQKFPGVSLKEITHVLNEFRHVTNRFSGLEISQVGKSCFIIKKNEKSK